MVERHMAYYHTVSLDGRPLHEYHLFLFPESFDLEPPPPKLKSYREAMSVIEYAQAFLDIKGHNDISTN